MNEDSNQAFLLLGSNISPVENLRKALQYLNVLCQVVRVSEAWENIAVGSPGPNFINLVVLIDTPYSLDQIKSNIRDVIEQKLGRIRSSDKNAPRTIDLDIIIFENQVLDQNLWTRLHIALPMSELLPELKNPSTGSTLKIIADSLLGDHWAVIRPEVKS